MHRLAITTVAVLAAASPAVAHADHDLSRTVRLAEVSADPRDGADTIALRGLGAFTHLELRAREAPVDIHGLGLQLRDGRVEWLDIRARIAPGEQRTIDLPYEARRADALVVDYGDPALRRRDRTPARLELYGATLDARGGDRLHDRDRERVVGRLDRGERWEPRARDHRAYRRDPEPRLGWR